jgi:hypothetical protein
MPTKHFDLPATETTTFVPAQTKHKATVARPRLFATYYYTDIKHEVTDWARIGRACTADGAVRAAVWKLLKKEAAHVDIYNDEGVRMAVIERRKGTIKIIASWL